MKYSLSDYTLTITPNDAVVKQYFNEIKIGGEGSYLDSINLSYDSSLFNTTGYATGAWVHTKNLAKTGTATVSLNQICDAVATLKKLCNLFYSNDYEGFTLSVCDRNGVEVANAIDCYIQSIPAQNYGETVAMQTWTFTCGQINFA